MKLVSIADRLDSLADTAALIAVLTGRSKAGRDSSCSYRDDASRAGKSSVATTKNSAASELPSLERPPTTIRGLMEEGSR